MRAYLVLGPESSGNRYLTRCLASGGAFGVGDVRQPYDTPGWGLDISEAPERISLYRSAPHGRLDGEPQWPDIHGHLRTLWIAGYVVDVLLIHREHEFVVRSQVNTGHATDETTARERIKQGERWIRHHLTEAGAWPQTTHVFYDLLCNENYRQSLAKRLGLYPFTEPFVDGDAKYREGAA